MSRKWFSSLLLLLIVSTLFSACQPLLPDQNIEPTSLPTPPGISTLPPASPTDELRTGESARPTLVATATSEVQTFSSTNRTGGWLDSIVMVEEPNAAVALTRIESGGLDLFASSLSDADLLKRTQESADLAYSLAYGSSTELTFNPVGPVFSATQQLNPFANSKIREAMNYLIDRDYIAQEIYGGMAVPRFTCVNRASPDFARMADLIRAVEFKYAYDPERAKEMIAPEMQAMGATLEDGKWMYGGQPVQVIVLIRTEDQRRAVGDYVANQLESIGFTVNRQYKNRAEAAPIWNGDPRSGLWNIYTGGWVTISIPRDEGSNFGYFYTPLGGPGTLWHAYQNYSEFFNVAEKLWKNDFRSLDERTQLFQQALYLSLEDSSRVWLVDQVSFTPYRADVAVATDLSGGVSGASLWALTLRREGQEGGSLTVAQPSLLAGAWNGVSGSNWVFDMMPQRATSGAGVLPDPYTGLVRPQRLEKAQVVVQAGLPVTKTLDWLTLETAISIEVPEDAWVGWDAENQKFITAGEKYTEPQTALSKITVYYPAGMYQLVKWHDGSPLSAADFVLSMILTFDRANPRSAIYDQAATADLLSYLSHFKGVRIVSTDPLVIETYDDQWYLDAESMVISWWPQYGGGEQPWHTLAVAILAESERQLAFSQIKAGELKVEWTNFIGGPSLDILKNYLDRAAEQTFVPYAPTLEQFMAPDEAASRYDNLAEWVQARNHFWVGTGPYYLDSVFPSERSLILKRFPDYPDLADRWISFSEPRLATAEVTGPGSVGIGQEATFEVSVTFRDQPYPIADVDQVKFVILDPRGRPAGTGWAYAVDDGHWRVTLDPSMTGALVTGLYRLEVAVVPKVVSIPAFASCQFTAMREGID